MIELRNIVQEYDRPNGAGRVRIIDDVSITIDKPGITMLLGPSGCGKSTLLKMMGGVRPYGVQTPTEGSVWIDGQPCTGAHPDTVMVFQQYANFPHLTVRENVAYPFRLKLWRDKVSPAERDERVTRVLEQVGLADRMDHLPSQLSGGQNQRLALAQALAVRPRILLMDEPFGALDAQIRSEMQALLVSLWQTLQCLVVFVTHDITEAQVLGDRILVLSTQPARIAADILVTEPRPRSDVWLRSTEVSRTGERIIDILRSGDAHGRGSLRVTV